MILKSLGIAIELCDISAPGMEVIILIEQDRKHDWLKQSGATGLHEGERGEEGGTEKRVAASSIQRGEVLRGAFRSLCLEGTFYIQGGLGSPSKTT